MIRSSMSSIPDGEYTRIFGHSGPKKVDYQELDSDHSISGGKINITLMDDDGKPIQNPTSFHRNKIYKQVKALREDLKSELCTKSECWNPIDKNVQKMVRELKNPRVQSFKLAMKAIGADPKDCDTERLRRR